MRPVALFCICGGTAGHPAAVSASRLLSSRCIPVAAVVMPLAPAAAGADYCPLLCVLLLLVSGQCWCAAPVATVSWLRLSAQGEQAGPGSASSAPRELAVDRESALLCVCPCLPAVCLALHDCESGCLPVCLPQLSSAAAMHCPPSAPHSASASAATTQSACSCCKPSPATPQSARGTILVSN